MATRRRAAGDGTLFKNARGYWVGGVTLPPGADGKPRVKRIQRKDRNDAIAALRELNKDLAAGQLATAPSTTLAKWLDYWLADILPHRGIKPGTATSSREHGAAVPQTPHRRHPARQAHPGRCTDVVW